MKLERPLIFFDVETTGVNVSMDRIISIYCIKIDTDEYKHEKEYLINPGVSIPESSTEIHGITDEMVKDKPKFKELATELFEFFEGCDIGGYNSNSFDVPILIEEFHRCNMDFDIENRNYIDVFKLETQVNPRTLTGVYKSYTGKDLDAAHNAKADVEATVEIFKNQILTHNLPKSIQKIDKISQGKHERVDLAGKLIKKDGELCWNFGKHRGKSIYSHIGYAKWFLNQDFPESSKIYVKRCLRKNNIE